MTWPAPKVPARIAADAEIPAGARRVATVARAAGWVVTATYARGTRPGREPRVVDNLALRMWRGRHRAAAVWLNARFDHAYTWSWDQPIAKCTATQLHKALKEERA